MKIAIDVSEMFGDEVRHLHGNLFRVRRSLIRMAKAGLSVEDGRLVYGNPRWFVNKDGSPEARGLESSKMDELRASIQNSGLDNPIRLRPVEADGGFLEVVNGERRLRSIEMLCEEDARCYDAAVGDRAPASEVYEWVDCRIEEMDDKAALGVALKTNETSEVIGDLASIQVVKTLRDAGYDDQEILLATGKSLSWLRETDRIIGLDDVCLGHFETDQITRKAALQLALIENAEERLSILEKIVGIARDRHSSKIKGLDKRLEDAEASEHVNSAAAKVAFEIGDDEQAKELAEAGKKARKKADKIREEHQKVSSKKPKADARDINRVRSPKSIPHSKIISEYIDVLDAIIENEGFDEDGDSLGLDLSLVMAVSGVLKAIMDGEEDSMSVFAAHCPILEDDEEVADESEEEDSDDEDSEEEDSEVSGEADEDYDEDEEETPAELESEFREASVYDDEDDD